MDGVLSKHGIDNLQLSIDLCEAAKKFFSSDNPAKTRESILKDIQASLEIGTNMMARIDEIHSEIKTRVHINPVGPEWEDFLRWAYQQERDKQEQIGRFLDWWVADEWRMAHPPSGPMSWYVKWPQAFIEEPKRPEKVNHVEDDKKYVPNPYNRAEVLQRIRATATGTFQPGT